MQQTWFDDGTFGVIFFLPCLIIPRKSLVLTASLLSFAFLFSENTPAVAHLLWFAASAPTVSMLVFRPSRALVLMQQVLFVRKAFPVPSAVCSGFLGAVVLAEIAPIASLFEFLGPIPRRRGAEFFNLDHDLLNTKKSESMWVNLGYWKHAKTFPDACRDLTLLLAEAAKLQQTDHVLDVGFGCGDQDILWTERLGLMSVDGVNISESQVGCAKRRVEQAKLTDRVRLRVGSATDLPYGDATFNKVLSLDSAYHYDTREKFFEEAFRVMEPGGCLALADIVLPKDALTKWSLGARLALLVVCGMCHIPLANAYDTSEYVRLLKRAGFVDIALTDVSEHVFPGFSAWVTQHENNLYDLVRRERWTAYQGAGWLFGKLVSSAGGGEETSWARFVVITACKPQAEAEPITEPPSDPVER